VRAASLDLRQVPQGLPVLAFPKRQPEHGTVPVKGNDESLVCETCAGYPLDGVETNEATYKRITHPRCMLELVSKDAVAREDFLAWAELLQLDQVTLVPTWWPWLSTSGLRLGPWERAHWFHRSLERVYRSKVADYCKLYSYQIDDPQIPQSLLVLDAIYLLRRTWASD
jgi:hypothetical protein